MEKRNYPIERKEAPQWKCPICNKIMSTRGRIGHLDKVHGQGLPLRENNPYPSVDSPLAYLGRPLEKQDIKQLVDNINEVGNRKFARSITGRRTSFLQIEYLFREFEIRFNCTLKEALQKFPEMGYE